MKTDDLIETLVRDGYRPRASAGQRIFGAILFGAVVSGVMFAFTLGVRPDIRNAFENGRFVFKFSLALICMACAWWACLQLAQPEMRWKSVAGWIALAPVLLSVAVCYELLTVSSTQWSERTIGNYAGTCLFAIPLLAVAPLLVLLTALRAGAPRSPTSAGAAAGLLAGGLSAALYATHCPDDSPLFVAVWYSLTVGFVALTGAVMGNRILKW
jgi:hypothetical protein